MPQESRKLGICCAKRQRSSVVSLSLTARSEDNSCGRVRKKFFNRVILLFLLLYFFLHTCCAHHTFFCQNEQSFLTYDGAKGIGNSFKELKTSSSSAGRNKMRRQLQSWVMYSKISVGAFKILRWTRRLWSPFRFVNVVGLSTWVLSWKAFQIFVFFSSWREVRNDNTCAKPVDLKIDDAFSQ